MIKVWGKGCFYWCYDNRVIMYSNSAKHGVELTDKRKKQQILRAAATFNLLIPTIGTIVKLRKIKYTLTVYGLANAHTVATFCDRAVFLKDEKGGMYSFSFQTYYKLLEKTYAPSYEKQAHSEIIKKFRTNQKRGKSRNGSLRTGGS